MTNIWYLIMRKLILNKEKIIKQNTCLQLKNDLILKEFIKKHFVIDVDWSKYGSFSE
mgnify:CR=1 FL=1